MADTKFSTGQTSGIAAGLNTNFANRAQAVWRQDLTSNVAVQGQLIQRGWTFVTWGGASPNSNAKTVTFPVAYDDAAYDITTTVIGQKNGGDPTSRTDTSGADDSFSFVDIGTSANFQIQARKGDGTNPAASVRTLISWIAIGTKL